MKSACEGVRGASCPSARGCWGRVPPTNEASSNAGAQHEASRPPRASCAFSEGRSPGPAREPVKETECPRRTNRHPTLARSTKPVVHLARARSSELLTRLRLARWAIWNITQDRGEPQGSPSVDASAVRARRANGGLAVPGSPNSRRPAQTQNPTETKSPACRQRTLMTVSEISACEGVVGGQPSRVARSRRWSPRGEATLHRKATPDALAQHNNRRPRRIALVSNPRQGLNSSVWALARQGDQ